MTDATQDPVHETTATTTSTAQTTDTQAAHQATQADGLQAEANALSQDWAAELAEARASDARADARAHDAPAVHATAAVFPALDPQTPTNASDIDMVMDIPVQLSVELGRTRLTIKNILQLGQGSVVELDGMAGEPMDICVNGYLIAQGEVVVVDEKYGIRVTDIVTPADRLHRLSQRR